MRNRGTLAAGLVISVSLVTSACGGTATDPPDSDPPEESPSARESSAEPVVDQDALVSEAERLVLAELPNIPLWKGTTAKGVFVSETEVCVDRTYAKKGFLGTKVAGFVIVTFPEGTTGEPQDGTCKREGAVPEQEPTPVSVPEDVTDEPGLLVSTDFGEDWPLTVPYAVVTCEDDSVILADPDGKQYAVNGTAQTFTDLPEIRPIWKDDPTVKGLKIDISPVIDRGLELC